MSGYLGPSGDSPYSDGGRELQVAPRHALILDSLVLLELGLNWPLAVLDRLLQFEMVLKERDITWVCSNLITIGLAVSIVRHTTEHELIHCPT